MTGMELVHVPGLGRAEGDREKQTGRARGRPKADEKFAIEQRRVQVAALYLSKMTERQMARHLGVSRSTIHKDIEAVKRTWRDRSSLDFQAIVDEEIAKLDGMERGLIPRALMGGHEAVNDLLRLMDRRARLLGLDKPVKIETTITIDLEAEKERGRRMVDELARKRMERTA